MPDREQHLADSAKSMRKVLSTKEEGRFAIAKGRTESTIKIYALKEDKSGNKSKNMFRDLKKELRTGKGSYGVIIYNEGTISFQVTNGTLKGTALLQCLKKDFNDAPAPLPILFKKVQIIEVAADGQTNVTDTFEGDKVISAKEYKKQLKQSIETDTALDPAEKRSLMRDLKELFQDLDSQIEQLNEGLVVIEDLDALFDDGPTISLPQPPTALDDFDTLDDLEMSLSEFLSSTQPSSIDLLEVPQVGEELEGLSQSSVMIRQVEERSEEDQVLIEKYIPEKNRLFTKFKADYTSEISSLKTNFDSKEGDNFKRIAQHVETVMFKPQLDTLEANVRTIESHENTSNIVKTMATIQEFKNFLLNDFKINTLDRRVPGISFSNNLVPTLTALYEHLSLYTRL